MNSELETATKAVCDSYNVLSQSVTKPEHFLRVEATQMLLGSYYVNREIVKNVYGDSAWDTIVRSCGARGGLTPLDSLFTASFKNHLPDILKSIVVHTDSLFNTGAAGGGKRRRQKGGAPGAIRRAITFSLACLSIGGVYIGQQALAQQLFNLDTSISGLSSTIMNALTASQVLQKTCDGSLEVAARLAGGTFGITTTCSEIAKNNEAEIAKMTAWLTGLIAGGTVGDAFSNPYGAVSSVQGIIDMILFEWPVSLYSALRSAACDASVRRLAKPSPLQLATMARETRSMSSLKSVSGVDASTNIDYFNGFIVSLFTACWQSNAIKGKDRTFILLSSQLLTLLMTLRGAGNFPVTKESADDTVLGIGFIVAENKALMEIEVTDQQSAEAYLNAYFSDKKLVPIMELLLSGNNLPIKESASGASSGEDDVVMTPAPVVGTAAKETAAKETAAKETAAKETAAKESDEEVLSSVEEMDETAGGRRKRKGSKKSKKRALTKGKKKPKRRTIRRSASKGKARKGRKSIGKKQKKKGRKTKKR